MNIYHIYCITNLVNGKKYIGQTGNKNPKKRWYDHRTASKTVDTVLYAAMRKYKLDNFSFEILCECIGQDHANKTEIEFIKLYDTYAPNGNGYNMTLGGGGVRGYKWSEEQKDKRRGENHPMYGLVGEKSPFWGKRKGIKLWDKVPHPLLGKVGVDCKNARTYLLYKRSGEQIIVTGLANWCREHGYSDSHIISVSKGKRKYHKDIVKVVKIDK